MQIFGNMLFNMFVNCLWSFGKVKEKKGENIQYMLHNTSKFLQSQGDLDIDFSKTFKGPFPPIHSLLLIMILDQGYVMHEPPIFLLTTQRDMEVYAMDGLMEWTLFHYTRTHLCTSFKFM